MNNLTMYEEWEWPWNKDKISLSGGRKFNTKSGVLTPGQDLHGFMTNEEFVELNDLLMPFKMVLGAPRYYSDGEYYIWSIHNPNQRMTYANIYSFEDSDHVILKFMQTNRKIKCADVKTAVDRILENQIKNKEVLKKTSMASVRQYDEEYPSEINRSHEEDTSTFDSYRYIRTFEENGSGDMPAACCSGKKKKKEKKQKKMKWSSDQIG